MKKTRKSKKKKKKIISLSVPKYLDSDSPRDRHQASALCLSFPLYRCARTAAVAAMLGRVPCALFEPAWRCTCSRSPFESRPVTLEHEPEYEVEVPHQDSLEVVLLSEGCTN